MIGIMKYSGLMVIQSVWAWRFVFWKKTGCKICNSLCDTNGRYVAINASANDFGLTSVSLYGPNKDDADFYDEFFF